MKRALLISAYIGIVLAIPASAGAAFLPGCANPADSALNQYCDAVPTTHGAQPPRAGGPALAGVLPPTVRRELLRSGGTTPAAAAARRRLLTLPAPARAANTTSPLSEGRIDAWSLRWWMIAVLAAIALGLLALAGERYRRSRGGSGAPGSATPPPADPATAP